MIYICILLQLITVMLFVIWFKPFRKKPKHIPEHVDLSEKEYLESLIPTLLPDIPSQLHQYKTLVIKSERKKQKWHYKIWNNDMSKKLIEGNSLAIDKRSYDELIKNLEQDIDQYLEDIKS